jgi:hypothetical protein
MQQKLLSVVVMVTAAAEEPLSFAMGSKSIRSFMAILFSINCSTV